MKIISPHEDHFAGDGSERNSTIRTTE